ncbi:hypothetical protein [Crocosphaera sp. XPORK-15E]|uniref:hypothetical protein n=1 Tax=Crocosphaera sp. XPORK-15E TaxID=3110247 RepID=UPI002B1E939E|nr:hypothetical protein [Crocosphaera sp. XPORK-15E]MEA5532944.1 hypothetical protein [Crocosphaera sp. XPORK-15E]
MTFSSISSVFSVSSAWAADFIFNATFSNGYTAKGTFTTKPGTPNSFSESNPNFPNVPFATQFLESTSLSVFDGTNTLLQTGSGVVNGISTNAFLRLDFDSSLSPNLTALNVNTETPTQNPYYFIGNNVLPDGTPVAPGTTDYNLFLYNRDTDNYTFLGSTTSIQATSVPESSSVISLLGLAALGAASAVKFDKKRKNEIN